MFKLLFQFIEEKSDVSEQQVDFSHLIRVEAANGDLLWNDPADLQFVVDFMAWLVDKKSTVRTVSDHRKLLSAFFDFLTRKGVLPYNPAKYVRGPKTTHKERYDWLQLGQAQSYLEGTANSEFPERDFALVLLMCLTGLRPASVAGLLVGDVELELEQIRVHNQVKRDEYCVAMPDNLALALREYLAHPRRGETRPSDRLFLNDKNTPFTTVQLRRHTEHLADLAGLDRSVKPYQCRHTAATLFYLSGASLVDVQHLLGHKQLKTTAMYTHGIDTSHGVRMNTQQTDNVLTKWLRGVLLTQNRKAGLQSVDDGTQR